MIVWLSLPLEILDNMYIAIASFPADDVINFELNLSFLIKPFFYITKKSRQKFKYPKSEKSHEKKNKKHFPSILKSFQLSDILCYTRVKF